MTIKYLWFLVSVIFLSAITGGCAYQNRLGMAMNPRTGVAEGSAIQKNIFIDPSQFENKKVKVSIRNTSGSASKPPMVLIITLKILRFEALNH